MKPQIIKGSSHKDHRGTIRFVNDFDLKDVKRFYTIQHPDTSIIRTWQCHEIETKYFFPLKGSFVVAWVEIDDFDKPSINPKADYKILKDNKSEVVYIPPGYANGFKALETNSEIAVFSDLYINESVKEKRHYPANWWFNWDQIY